MVHGDLTVGSLDGLACYGMFRTRKGGLVLVHSMVCPIIVEDLNPPRNFLVEGRDEDGNIYVTGSSIGAN
ncbi:hypothetical protein LguiB_031620 [Lonicera macranthoides]